MEKRRIIPAFLVLFVIFAIVPRPGAAAAGLSGLEVTGQTAMTQQTFTDLSVIGADSCGLTDAINGAKNPAQTIGEWIKGYWDSWLLRQQLTWGTVLNIAAAGARYTGNGDLLFNSQLSDLFTRFYNWLWDGEGGPNILQYADTIPSDEAHVVVTDGMKEFLHYPNAPYGNLSLGQGMIGYESGNTDYTYYVDGNRYASCLLQSNNPGNYLYLIVSDTNLSIEYYENGSFKRYYSLNSTNAKNGQVFYYRAITVSTELDPIGLSVSSWPDTFGSTNAADLAYIIYGGGLQIGEDQILGDPDKLGGLTGSERKRVAPPDIINFPDFGGNSGSIDVSDYIGGLRGAIESQDGTADVNITDSEGVQSTETMTIDQATDIPAETETTAEAVNQGELISTATPSTELADYTIDLRNYFPFCIPWDLYDMITLLVAEPVAPHVQYPFVIEPLNVNYTIDLDFSQFDSVAAVLRTMELLAAGIGLALMTKRLIQGGD